VKPVQTATTLVGLLTVAAASVAQSPGQASHASASIPIPRTEFLATMDTEFRKMDGDKNGIVTKQEIEGYQRAMSALIADARRQALFSALDSDKNGMISSAEFARMPVQAELPNAAPILAQIDLNHDGSVSLVEYRTAKLANFDRMDSDKDGVVSVAEMKAAGLVK
jgi:Ca2+-binding EF-hand superfamily protein